MQVQCETDHQASVDCHKEHVCTPDPQILSTLHHLYFKTITWFCNTGGVFAQRGHSANYYSDYQGNSPENHPPAESCTINSKLKNSNT